MKKHDLKKPPEGILFNVDGYGSSPIAFTACACHERSKFKDFDSAKAELIRRQKAKIADAQAELERFERLTYEDVYASPPVRRVGDDFIPAAASWLCGCSISLSQASWLDAFQEAHYREDEEGASEKEETEAEK